MTIYQKLNDSNGKASVLLELAALSRLEDPDRALVEYRRALELFRQYGDVHNQAEAQAALAHLHAAAGRIDDAERAFRQALLLAKRADRPVLSARLWAGLAQVQLKAERKRAALESYEEALQALAGARASRLRAQILLSAGDLRADLGEPSEARKAYLEALGIYQEIPDEAGQTRAIRALSALLGEPTAPGTQEGAGGGKAGPGLPSAETGAKG